MNHKDVNSTAMLSLGLIQRQADGAQAIRLLIDKTMENQHVEFGIGIILRSALLDALIVLNLYAVIDAKEKAGAGQPNDPDPVKGYCDMMLADGLGNTIKYIKAAKDTGIINEEKYRETLKTFTERHTRFFEPYANDGSLPVLKIKDYLSPTELFKRVAHHPELKEMSKIYDAYLFFSKYDHFGILYYEVIHEPFDQKLHLIGQAIETMTGAVSVLHTSLRIYHPDGFLSEQSNKVAQYLFEQIIAPNIQPKPMEVK